MVWDHTCGKEVHPWGCPRGEGGHGVGVIHGWRGPFGGGCPYSGEVHEVRRSMVWEESWGGSDPWLERSKMRELSLEWGPSGGEV